MLLWNCKTYGVKFGNLLVKYFDLFRNAFLVFSQALWYRSDHELEELLQGAAGNGHKSKKLLLGGFEDINI